MKHTQMVMLFLPLILKLVTWTLATATSRQWVARPIEALQRQGHLQPKPWR
jgi:hypothetical protein